MNNSNYEKLKKEFKTITFKNKLKEILGNECVNCGHNKNIHYHHIVPLVKGGTNNLRNIVPLCQECHGSVHGNKFYQCLAEGKRLAKQKEGFTEGRPPKYTKEDLGKALELKQQGLTYDQVKVATGIGKTTLWNYMKKLNK